MSGPWGARIRAVRLQRAKIVPSAFSVIAVANRIGVNDRTFRSWEAGETRPHARHARRLAKELGVAVEELGLDDAAPTSDHEVKRTG